MKKALSLLILLSACNFQNFEKQIQSRPEFEKTKTYSNEKRVLITGTHQFDIFPEESSDEYSTSQISTGIKINSGGLNLLQTYLTILESKYPNQTLHLSFGSKVNKIENISKKKKTLEKGLISVASFTENDLLLFQINKPTSLNSNVTHINTNIINLKNNKPLQKSNIKPYKLKIVNGIKVGVMSVTTFTPDKAYSKKIKGLYFEDPVLSVLKNSKELKKKGAQILVLLLNAKDGSSDTSNFVKRLPHKGVDVIFSTSLSGKNYTENGINILSDKGHGKYLNYIEIIYDTDFNQISKRKTKLVQAVKLCKDFYTTTDDCFTCKKYKNTERIKAIVKDNSKLKNAKFLGVEIKH